MKKYLKSTGCPHKKNATPVKTDIHPYVENYRMSKLKCFLIFFAIEKVYELFNKSLKSWVGNLFINIYFGLRFGSANAINDYLRLKICVVCIGNF